jgi:hypothetical protein
LPRPTKKHRRSSRIISYVIKLENEGGQKGYHGLIGAEGEYLVFQGPDNAVRFASEEDPEAALYRLEAQHGINREEAKIDLIADDRTADLELGGNYYDDGISVVENDDGRYVIVRNGGVEEGELIPPEVADLLVPVLLKIRNRLASRGDHFPGKKEA